MKLLAPERRIILKNIETPNLHQLSVYQAAGGYQTARKAVAMNPDAIIEEVKKSGIRGRGGAGFPTGSKWGFVPFKTGKPIYLLCNADESEPGCFKDRLLLERNPHQLIEGIIIASFAVRSLKSYIYIRGEYATAAKVVQKAIDEAYGQGFLGKNVMGSTHTIDVVLHRGAGAYICGEETGLISSLEGKKGYPRLKPPFPAVSGFLNCPTVVNNVETLSTVPWILANGGEAYATYGTEQSRGTRLFCVSGWVNRPGVYEEELGCTLRDMIDGHAGGMKEGAKLKAVIPGGSSTPPLTPEEVDKATLDFETMAKFGTFLGAGGIIVIPDHFPLLKLLERLTEFYWDESCGQCTPCREGTGWLYKMMKAIEHGKGTAQDVANLQKTANQMMGVTICALSDAAAMPVLGFLKKFPNEFKSAREHT
ncbi:MAG: NADH-quinone oxidoreductase subunit NuoF [Deltaproteobacteria bacterium]|nr:NADH-quinone oxidoreductase subunit NuoF [Deltaproteobacteria bacterium]MBI3296032.1 NADH-quinone oxidoreductase subunit NuoF [Deltaproteobacteria bacterium]